MRPENKESQQLVAILTRNLAAPQASAAAATKPGKLTQAAPPADISSDTLALFVTRVQPILMNTCLNCHSNGKGGNFQLTRAESGQQASTQVNLSAVLKQVNVDNANLSPLLIKSVSRHGTNTQSPIKDRKAVAYQTMVSWIEYLVANNPQLRVKEIASERRESNGPAEKHVVSGPIESTSIANSSGQGLRRTPGDQSTFGVAAGDAQQINAPQS